MNGMSKEEFEKLMDDTIKSVIRRKRIQWWIQDHQIDLAIIVLIVALILAIIVLKIK